MDYKAIRSHVAEMNRHVSQLKKDANFKNVQAKKLIGDFMTTYKTIQLWIREPLESFAGGATGKAIKLQTLYDELKGWYSALTAVDDVLNKVTKIKDNEGQAAFDFKDLKKGGLIKCPQCDGAESPNSVELEKGNLWKCHECGSVFTPAGHGGARAGAGRKSIGVKKHMAITMPKELWDEIDNLIQNDKISSYSEYFRQLAAGAKSR